MKISHIICIAIAMTMTSACKKKYTCTLTNLTTGQTVLEREVDSEAECEALRVAEERRLNGLT